MATSEGRVKPGGNFALTCLVTVLLLVLTDAALDLGFRRLPQRFPEHFSSLFMQRYADQLRTDKNAVLVVGDSVLWGYGTPASTSMVARLRERFPDVRFVNLAYEAGGPINADFLLRYLLARKIRPRAVIFDLNPISFNQTTKAYDSLNAALERLAIPSLETSFDKHRLVADEGSGRFSFDDRADRFLEAHWILYGARVDIHQALFGDADAATALFGHMKFFSDGAQPPVSKPSGMNAYTEMYDLTPLTQENVAYAYTGHFLQLLKDQRIPSVGFLTPTNHALLRAEIDFHAYDENLQRLEHLCRANGATALNLDRLLDANQFIDNTHLTESGNRRLANALTPAVMRMLHAL